MRANGKKQINVTNVPHQMFEETKIKAVREGRPVAEIVRELIGDWLKAGRTPTSKSVKIEPHFLVEVFRVASEARNHMNNFLHDDDSDDVEISPEVIDFFVELISNHPDEQVSRWFVNELRGEHERNS